MNATFVDADIDDVDITTVVTELAAEILEDAMFVVDEIASDEILKPDGNAIVTCAPTGSGTAFVNVTAAVVTTPACADVSVKVAVNCELCTKMLPDPVVYVSYNAPDESVVLTTYVSVVYTILLCQACSS